MFVDWNIVFDKIRIEYKPKNAQRDFSCYDTQIRNGVDRKTIISKTCSYIYEKLTNEELEVINGEALFEAVRYAVKNFDIKGEYKLGQHINNILIKRKPDIIEGDILNAQYKNRAVVKKYYNFKKDLKKANINWDELSSNEQVEVAKQFGISELQLKNMLGFQNFTNSDRLYSVNQDDEEYDKNGIEDKSAEDAITRIERYEYKYDMFSYIFKNSKEKKHEVFKMIDGNEVRNKDYDPLEFIEFVDMEYIRYVDKYGKYEDVDIVSYKWFGGKRSTDKDVSKKKFGSRKSSFKITYKTPYEKLQDKFNEIYRNI